MEPLGIIWCIMALPCATMGAAIYGEKGLLLGLFFGIFGVMLAAILSLHPDYKRAEKYIAARHTEWKFNQEQERLQAVHDAKIKSDQEKRERKEKEEAIEMLKMEEEKRKQAEEEINKIEVALRREEDFRLKKERISQEYKKQKDAIKCAKVKQDKELLDVENKTPNAE